MTETARIRWKIEPEVSSAACAGYAGTFGRDLFRIYAPDESDDRWILASLLPESDHRSAYGESAEELKPIAERLLSEFVSSLGAVFPDEPGRPSRAWHADWVKVDRDQGGNAILRHKPTGGLYKILPVEEY